MTRIGYLAAWFLAWTVSCVQTQANEAPTIALSGFGDVLYVHDTAALDEDTFGLGQAEVDLDASFGEKFHAAVAIAYDVEQEHFGLGAFTLNYHVLGTEGAHFRRGGHISHSGVLAGRFDVPFGLDWRVLPSIDRHLVSAPLVVDHTHDSWNDVGCQLYAVADFIGVTAFACNGWDYDASEWVTVAADDSLGRSTVISKHSFGGRLGLKPLPNLELGGSYARLSGRDDTQSMCLTGADLSLANGPLTFKGEFVAHRIDLGILGVLENSGFYIQGLLDFGSCFLVGRYGEFAPDLDEKDFTRLCGGLGWRILEGGELRCEYQNNGEDAEDRFFLQLVAGF